MRHLMTLSLLLCAAVATGRCLAADAQSPVLKDWQLDGVKREATIHAPAAAKSELTPLVFVFHGHGGSMNNAARTFPVHQLWPEAIVVYPQGLNTPGKLTDPEGKRTGWQSGTGDQQDRDLKFFDVMLKSLREDYKIDPKRVYCTGHSNGGGFTYLLWAARGDVFTAVAPSSAVAPKELKTMKPKPVLHVAGKNDPLVKYAWQEQMIQAIKKIDGCEGEGKKDGELLTTYPSPGGTPVVTLIHDGGHAPPKEAAIEIVKFFKGQIGK